MCLRKAENNVRAIQLIHSWRKEICKTLSQNKNVIKYFTQCSPNHLKALAHGLLSIPLACSSIYFIFKVIFTCICKVMLMDSIYLLGPGEVGKGVGGVVGSI